MTNEREVAWLAPYAMRSAQSAGRRHPEPPHPYRGPYQRDRDRIVHSSAFRRLSYKTQVFMGEMGDYHRTRLTHTLEVASIARTMARALRLNEDMVEALSLAHDIGHPPFGHSGEDVLNECLVDHGGFNHNAQALRIFELLETRYPEFPGLNLSQEVLDGQRQRVKTTSKLDRSQLRNADCGLRNEETNPKSEIRNPKSNAPLLEVQIVDAADSIAYDAHDADDSLEIGLLRLDQLLEIPLWQQARDRVARRFANLDDRQLRRAIVHELIDWQASDIVRVVERTLRENEIDSVAAARQLGAIACPSAELAELKPGLQRFLFDNVYRHEEVLRRRQEAQQALSQMYAALVRDPSRLPAKFARLAESDGVPRAVGDYVAGMTDRFALDEYQRLLDSA